MLGQVGESAQEAYGSLQEDACHPQEKVSSLEEEACSCSQSSHCEAQEVHEEQGLQSKVFRSPQGSHRSLQEVEGSSQEAHEKQEVEAQVLPQALLPTGSSYEAQVEEDPCMPEEQEMQG